MRLLTRILALATVVFAIQTHVWSMAEEDLDQDILEMKKQLESMETRNGRSLDLYELRYFPGPIKSITVTNRLGEGRVYYYTTFRLRNPGLGGDDGHLETEYIRYNEILQNIANEFENIQVEGGRLTVDTETENDAAAVILKRDELRSSERTVRLSVSAYDENGTRIRILDAIPGEGPQEQFNFPDEGQRSVNVGVSRVRERIEEKEGQRLLLTSEIAQHVMPVYQPGKYDENGDVLGEMNGVIIFDDLAINGDKFEIQIRGISNKTRRRIPDHEMNQIADYWNMRIYRRSYYVTYKREGDEYFRERDAFELVDQGWRWRNTFQRIEQRASMAHVEYFLNNIADDKGNENAAMVKKTLAYYESEREKRRELVDEQKNLPEFEQDMPDIKALMQDGE